VARPNSTLQRIDKTPRSVGFHDPSDLTELPQACNNCGRTVAQTNQAIDITTDPVRSYAVGRRINKASGINGFQKGKPAAIALLGLVIGCDRTIGARAARIDSKKITRLARRLP
jgi:hypothetical protein